jgi:hypothetical protein
MHLFFIIGVIGAFVSTFWIIILALQKELTRLPLIICGILWILALGTFCMELFGGKYDEQYAIYHTYIYFQALERFKNDKHYYPPDLATLFTKGYMDKKLSKLRYATDFVSARGSYYFVYKRAGDNFTLYAKSVKIKPTFFVDQTGSIRLDNARGVVITKPFAAQRTNLLLPQKSVAGTKYHRF